MAKLIAHAINATILVAALRLDKANSVNSVAMHYVLICERRGWLGSRLDLARFRDNPCASGRLKADNRGANEVKEQREHDSAKNFVSVPTVEQYDIIFLRKPIYDKIAVN